MSTAKAQAQSANGGKSKVVAISMMTLAIMNITTIISLRGLPSQAEYGLTSIFYYVLAALVFLIPTALVSAELASSYPEKGGIFRWVSEAFGPNWGFAAIYYQWQAVVIWFPTVLIFAGVALAYIAWPASFDAALASNKWYILAAVLIVYWAVTLNTFRGMKSSATLSSLGGLFGTIIPGAILILLAIVYVVLGHPIQMPLNTGFFPDFTNIQNIVLAASIFLFFAGMEMQAVHITALKNPGRNYPLTVLIATIVVVVVFILGTLAVGAVIPQKEINLTQSLMIAYRDLWSVLRVPWMGNVMAVMIAFGVLGQVSVIVAGPSAGLLAVGRAGYLPRYFQRTNKNAIQVPILIVQGVIISILALALTVLPSVQSGYQILGQMATIIYLCMYLIMYVAAIRLRYTEPHKHRPFQIPGGKIGMWFVGTVGLVGAFVAIVLSFFPPKQVATGNPAIYVGILLVGSAVFLAIPFVIYAFRKPDWKSTSADFAKFDWEAEGRKPSQVSTLKKGDYPNGNGAKAADAATARSSA